MPKKIDLYDSIIQQLDMEIEQALNVCGYGAVEETKYHEIFLMDNWSYSEAMLFLVGIFRIDQDPSISEYEALWLYTLDGILYRSDNIPGNDYLYIDFFNHEVKRLTKLWLSGNHPMKNPPAYYINWAESKGYKIPWLKFVVDEGLYIPSQLLGNKPLVEKERDTLSVIIAALAKEAGLDITKVSKTAEIIARTTQEMGTPVGATTIETHLKRIPQALATRIK